MFDLKFKAQCFGSELQVHNKQQRWEKHSLLTGRSREQEQAHIEGVGLIDQFMLHAERQTVLEQRCDMCFTLYMSMLCFFKFSAMF